jgi:hypothetical protein
MKLTARDWWMVKRTRAMSQLHALVYCEECDADKTIFHHEHVGRGVIQPYDRTWEVLRDIDDARMHAEGVSADEKSIRWYYYRDPLPARLIAMALKMRERVVSSGGLS